MTDEPTTFLDDVAAVVRAIPRGRATTYGEVARAVGRPSAARWVAGALRRSTERDPEFPWHRVVAAGGRIATYRAGLGDLQAALLRSEGGLTHEGHVPQARLWIPGQDDAGD